MASPSERPHGSTSSPRSGEPLRKDGIRCDGTYEKGHKFAGQRCNALLLEKDPELGLGARCGRCGTFHPFSEIIKKANFAAPDTLQPVRQVQDEQTQPRKQGEEKMASSLRQTKEQYARAEARQACKVVEDLLEKYKTGTLTLLKKEFWGKDNEGFDDVAYMLIVGKEGTTVSFKKHTRDRMGFPYFYKNFTLRVTTVAGEVLVDTYGDCHAPASVVKPYHHALCPLWKKVKKFVTCPQGK